jgi:type II secretory pathway component GspD/PulD (secretin)
MKHLLFTTTVILAVLITAAYCPGKDTQDKKNPFGPLDKETNLNPAEVVESDSTVSEPAKTLAAEVFHLNSANAKQMEKTISSLVSRSGKVGIDERLNSIVVTDTTASLERIRQVISKLDAKAPQVMIEALIVNVKLTNEFKMGVDWTKLGNSKNFLSQGLNITGSTNP